MHVCKVIPYLRHLIDTLGRSGKHTYAYANRHDNKADAEYRINTAYDLVN